MKFKRRLDGFLSEEHIKQQLLTLALILVASFFIFLGISAIFFPGDFNWRQIIALYLDPGVFDAYSGKHTWFPLIITFVGIFVFTALLITVFINVFSNISDAYRKGERRYSGMKGHTLILGANRMLIGMLTALKAENVKNILIMTASPVESLRDKIEAYFGDNKFMKRITFYYDERNNLQNLKEACARDAKEIFIIGEDGEVDHDSVSISCCEKLEEICKDSPHPVHCFLVLDNQSSAEVYHYHKKESSQETKLLVDVVDIKEYVAEQTLLGKNGDGQLSIDGCGIKAGDEQFIHFIISGMTPMAKAMALTAAHLCHFPNFDPKTGARKTVITFIDYDIKRKRDIFISEHQNLFMLSHYSDIWFDNEGNQHTKSHVPNSEYDDFLDVAWEFVDADISSSEAKEYLKTAVNDAAQQLAVAICQKSQEDNMSAALHLPSAIYDKSKNIPIYVHLWEQGDAITKANGTGQFGNIYCFGTGTTADKDPLFENRLKHGQRVNFIYSYKNGSDKAFGNTKEETEELIEKKWYAIPEANKFSSIYSANSIPIKKRSFGEDLSSTNNDSLNETEHRRWVIAELLLGYKPFTKKELCELKSAKKNSPAWKAAWNRRNEDFHHVDIDAYANLIDEDERNKDSELMKNIPFITGDSDQIK